MPYKIGIIGGGISGVITAIKLSELENVSIDIYEKRGELLNSSPYCHLHAGGFLYPMLTTHDCQELLSASLDFANYLTGCLDLRPTIVAYRADSNFNVEKLNSNGRFLNYVYEYNVNLTGKRPLGDPIHYYALYTRDDVVYYKEHGEFPGLRYNSHLYHDKYVGVFCKLLNDIDSVKYPFISVMEPGINQKKAEASLLKKLKCLTNVKTYLNTHADVYLELNTTENRDNTTENGGNSDITWYINGEHYDFLIDATGPYHMELDKKIRDMTLPKYSELFSESRNEIIYYDTREIRRQILRLTMNLNNMRSNTLSHLHGNHYNDSNNTNNNDNNIKSELLEIKASWYIKCDLDSYRQFNTIEVDMPEIAIIGERGTDRGMIQLTPTDNPNEFVVHCMTKNSSLVECAFANKEEGVSKMMHELFSEPVQDIVLNDQISNMEIYNRANNALKNIIDIFPAFQNAEVVRDKCNWGVQRVPSINLEHRNSKGICRKNYAELQVTKACNAVTVANDVYKYINGSFMFL